jgi:hypothetical protein
MPEKPRQKTITFAVSAKFQGVTDTERPPDAFVHAFDSRGRYLVSALIEKEKAKLSLPSAEEGRTVRLLFGPGIEGDGTPTLSGLLRLGALEKRMRIDPKNLRTDLTILDSVWKKWLLCVCSCSRDHLRGGSYPAHHLAPAR